MLTDSTGHAHRPQFYEDVGYILGNASDGKAFESCDCAHGARWEQCHEYREYSLTDFRIMKGHGDRISLAFYVMGPEYRDKRMRSNIINRAVQVNLPNKAPDDADALQCTLL